MDGDGGRLEIVGYPFLETENKREGEGYLVKMLDSVKDSMYKN